MLDDRRWTANSIAFGGKFHVPAEKQRAEGVVWVDQPEASVNR